MEMQIGFARWSGRSHAAALEGAHADRRPKRIPVLDDVARRLSIADPSQAVPVLVAVLQPLLGCLSLVDGAHLETVLPRLVRRHLRHDHPILGVSFQPPDRFLTELAGREGVDVATAAAWTRAVCAALAEELPPGVLARITAQVPALVRAFFPDGERLAPPPPERTHRSQEIPPMWSQIERSNPSYLMFASGDPITGRPTEGVARQSVVKLSDFTRERLDP